LYKNVGLWCLTPLSTILQLYRGGHKKCKNGLRFAYMVKVSFKLASNFFQTEI